MISTLSSFLQLSICMVIHNEYIREPSHKIIKLYCWYLQEKRKEQNRLNEYKYEIHVWVRPN